ncbi:MAG: DUF4124 domain-containing protein [Geobacteraceae bacterium]|nr:DUF4124 domain-containing protein [Geobacteraceae bacterium]
MSRLRDSRIYCTHGGERADGCETTEKFSLCVDSMNLIIVFTLVILCSSAVANAETYMWTDDQGTVTFTDNPDRLPPHYSRSEQRGDNVINLIPTVENNGRRQDKKQLQATIPRNRIKSTIARAKQTTSPQGMLQPSRD